MRISRGPRLLPLVTHGYKPTAVGWLVSRIAPWRQVPFVRGYTDQTRRVRRYEELPVEPRTRPDAAKPTNAARPRG